MVSNLKKTVEYRSGAKKPIVADWYNGDAILESLADKIIFLHQHQKYGFLEDEEGDSLKDHAEIILEKNKFGPTGTTLCLFDENSGRFINKKGAMRV